MIIKSGLIVVAVDCFICGDCEHYENNSLIGNSYRDCLFNLDWRILKTAEGDKWIGPLCARELGLTGSCYK